MPTRFTQYTLLISCPNDVSDDIAAIKKAVSKFNTTYSAYLGIKLETKYWKDNVFPQSGGQPQELIEKQIVFDCDFCVALLWTKFGTPTEKYGSGTEQEIEQMLSTGKQVFMYFSDSVIQPSMLDSTEYKRVLQFKNSYKTRGIYFTYSSKEQLEDMLFQHLSLYFQSKKKEATTNQKILPVLDLVCMIGDQPSDELLFRKFKTSGYFDIEKALREIKTLVDEINSIHLQKQNAVQKSLTPSDQLSHFGMEFQKPVVIDSSMSEFIRDLSSSLGIALSSDFSELGDLRISTITIIGRGELIGSPQEKAKYREIEKLYDLMFDFNILFRYCTDVEQLLCIGLALRNSGTQTDEDIDVTLTFPKGTIIRLKDLPTPSNGCSELLIEDGNIRKLFGIKKSQNAISYWEKNKSVTPIPSYDPMLDIINTHNFVKDYYLLLKNEFAYAFYLDGEMDIVEIHFDDIKQNTVISFPTVLFVNNKVDAIGYSIRSKHIPEIAKGVLRKGNE